MEEYISVLSKLGRTIRTSKTYWQKIVRLKHPVMEGKEKEVKETLENPWIVKQSDKDENVCLYYRPYNKRYICVVVRHENGKGFIISTYPVDTVSSPISSQTTSCLGSSNQTVRVLPLVS